MNSDEQLLRDFLGPNMSLILCAYEIRRETLISLLRIVATERTRRESAERELAALQDQLRREMEHHTEALNKRDHWRTQAAAMERALAKSERRVAKWKRYARRVYNQNVHYICDPAGYYRSLKSDLNAAQSDAYRKMKNVERLAAELNAAKSDFARIAAASDREVDELKAELQAARMPDEVRATVRDALVFSHEDHDTRAAHAWLDSIAAARKDVANG